MFLLQRLFPFRIFKFRTKLSEELEDLHNESVKLEKALAQTRLRERQWTKWFAIYTLLIFLATNILYYTCFLPKDYLVRTYAVFCSIMLAVLIYAVYWLMCYYFRTVVQLKEDRLTAFKTRKQELIEEVKKKETYAVAKALLEKFDESSSRELPNARITDQDQSNLRQRRSIRPGLPNSPPVSVPAASQGNIGRIELINSPVINRPQAIPMSPAGHQMPIRLPRTILPPQQTWWGSILDTIVGDGPSKRYALICKSCQSHNGMALEEEFEYLAFRCAYCNYLNSARKQKPVFHDNAINHNNNGRQADTSAANNPETNELSSSESESASDPVSLTRTDEGEPSASSNNYPSADTTPSDGIQRRSVMISPEHRTSQSRSRSTSFEHNRLNLASSSKSKENLS